MEISSVHTMFWPKTCPNQTDYTPICPFTNCLQNRVFFMRQYQLRDFKLSLMVDFLVCCIWFSWWWFLVLDFSCLSFSVVVVVVGHYSIGVSCLCSLCEYFGYFDVFLLVSLSCFSVSMHRKLKWIKEEPFFKEKFNFWLTIDYSMVCWPARDLRWFADRAWIFGSLSLFLGR